MLMKNQMAMGIFSLERSEILYPKNYQNPASLNGFLVSGRPICGISLNARRMKQSWFFSVRSPNCRTINALSKGEYDDNGSTNSGKVLEKEFKFQPTFDEYLKAMESVRTYRENNPIGGADAYHPRRKNSKLKLNSAEPNSDRDEEKLKLSSEKHSSQVKNTEFLEGDGLSENSCLKIGQERSGRGKLGFREKGNRTLKDKGKPGNRVGFLEKGGERSAWDSVQHKLKYGENNVNLMVERGLRGYGDKRTSERINGRWMNNQNNSVERKMGDSGFSKSKNNIYSRERGTYGKSDYVTSLTSNEDEGKLGQNENTTEMQKKQLIKNAAGSTEFSGIRERGSENIKIYKSNVDMRPNVYRNNKSLTEKKKFYGSHIERRAGEITSGKEMSENEYFNMNDVARKMEDTEITSMGRGKYYENQIPVRFSNVSEMEQHGPRSRDAYLRMDNGHIQIDDTRRKSSLRSGKSTRGNMDFMDDESDVKMERAAFKSFEVFTDVRGMPRVSRMEMEERIQNLAKWLNGADINLPEWMFSKMMRSAKIRFSDSSILRVIQVLGRYGNWRRVLQVIEWFQSRERFKYIYTAALDVLGKAKRPVEALNVFHAMRQELSSYPDLAAYHCIAVTLGQAGHMKELLDVIDCMRSPPQKKFKLGVLEKWDPRLEPDLVIYNAVLNACIRRKQWEGAFWVLQQLKQQGLQPSSTTYGLVMEVLLACDKYNLVHEFFRKVEKSSIPNSLNYRVLVNTLWKEGKTDEAVVAVQEMERRGIVGSASLYYDLARCLCSAGRCQEALMQIDKICKVANKPLVVTYTGLIQACLDSGNVQNGSYIFEQMHKFCSPNVVTCNIMLKGYLEHGLFEKAKELFQQMLDDSNQISSIADYKERVPPDNYTFNTMLDACIAEKKWDDFKYVYQRMLHHGYHFNTKRHLRMLLEACRAGQGELLEITWKHLIRADRIPPAPIIKERFCMKLEEDDFAGAISCITSRQATNELHAFSEKVWLDLFKTNANRFQEDTLVRLVHELNNITAGSDQPHPILQNLITSCREFIRTHTTVADSILNEITLV
ncbi:Pentatricopeptide repeat [Macleaya cordata]|uniref:Pentatricopeptide repeat n=1 Tax=Macleaya cordata TaxID=56857 RepID=A0A200QA79_MACCD|nr:Pentatricopeptide repeat [Macleaya cordata]